MRGGKRQGAGRKPAPPRVAITLRVDEQTAARFSAYCAEKATSQAKAFTAWVRRLPNDKGQTRRAPLSLYQPDGYTRPELSAPPG